MKLIIGIAALVIAVIIFLKMRSQAAQRDARKLEEMGMLKSRKPDFHAVSIRPGISACSAARQLEGQRFLSNVAPRIPLPDCDSTDCTCRFAHYEDRRAGEDRRTPFPSTIGLDARTNQDDKRRETERRRKLR